MANSKHDALLAALTSDPASVGLFSVGATTEQLTHTEVAAALSIPWPDDTPFVSAVCNTKGLYTHVTPDANEASRDPQKRYLSLAQTVKLDPRALTNGFYQLDNKLWASGQYLDLLTVSSVVKALDILYKSQWGPGADKRVNDCGAACIWMLLNWLAKLQGKPAPTVTVDDLAMETALATSDTGLPTSALIDLAAKNGLKLVLTNAANLNSIRAELNVGRPVISLINYSQIKGRHDPDPFGHFVVVIGYDANNIIIHDPDWNIPGGANFVVPNDQYEAAINTAPGGAYQACFVDAAQLVPTPGVQAEGVDIYHGNTVDIAALASSNQFIIHKASEGTYMVDASQTARKAAAKAANPAVLWGVYHFATGADVEAQVDKFITAANFDGATIACLDWENNPDNQSGTEGSMTDSQAAEFCQKFHDKTGKWPVVYTRKGIVDQYVKSTLSLDAVFVLAQCPLWIASDQNPPILPTNVWKKWAIQQSGSTPNGQDLDKFNGDAAALRTWWAANAVPAVVPTPVPVPKPKAVGSAIGFHIMPGANLAKIMDVLKACAAAGKPVRGVKLLLFGNDELPEAVKQASPQTEVAVRIFNPNWENRAASIQWGTADLTAVGHQYATDWIAENVTNNQRKSSVDFWQILNEPGYGAGTASFWDGVLGVFEAAGLHCIVYGFPVGTPQLPSDGNNFWQTQVPLIQRIKANGHRFAVDEYGMVSNMPLPRQSSDWQDDWSIQRHTRVLACFPPDLQDVPIVNPEFGTVGGAAMGLLALNPDSISIVDDGTFMGKHHANLIKAAMKFARVKVLEHSSDTIRIGDEQPDLVYVACADGHPLLERTTLLTTRPIYTRASFAPDVVATMLQGWSASDDYVDQHGANIRWRAAWTMGDGGDKGWDTDTLDSKLDAIQAYLLAR